MAITASIYHRGTVPVGEYLWAVPFFPNTNVEFFENIYHYMGLKELWQEAYEPHNVKHLAYTCSTSGAPWFRRGMSGASRTSRA